LARHVARKLHVPATMGALGHLPELEDDLHELLADIRRPGPADLGASGYRQQRRLGLRGQSRAWALLTRGTFSAYAMAVELSATGAVLEFVGRRFRLVFRPHLRFGLDLFVPETSSHIHAVVRSVRPIDDRQAFEFVEIAAADRLTLAEYLDRLTAGHDRHAEHEHPRRRHA
jgi:hypothetical protein